MEPDFSNEDELFEAAVKAFESERTSAIEKIEDASDPNLSAAVSSSITSMYKTALEGKKPTKLKVEDVFKEKDA